ncbi:Txe/YoeB family addiction module toxin [Epilithonimonas xixisoli]|uniref:Putative mRNA interferase YoeB n=1 Tax=Epilithonimonas xixisoli TaxID=1476462 RepID=A0A4R8I7E8_9FLAO|nr:Txe/YoeB family addiction module toxin [Epilithonimonas xixisoli]TDX84579.1 toxin YoeB [Epilithonimonas xixisoli]
MEKYYVEIEKSARKDIQKIYKSGNTRDIKRFEQIIMELSENPREGIGNPERLKHFGNEEFWSRELNKKDRVVYQIIDNEIIVIVASALGHYKDK